MGVPLLPQKMQLFLSSYVDDYRVAGKNASVPKMWKILKEEGLDLEPPVPLNSNIYLGCGQRDLEPDFEILLQKRNLFDRLCNGKGVLNSDKAQRGLEARYRITTFQ